MLILLLQMSQIETHLVVEFWKAYKIKLFVDLSTSQPEWLDSFWELRLFFNVVNIHKVIFGWNPFISLMWAILNPSRLS